MKFLELKIPPLLLLIAFLGGAWGLRQPMYPLIEVSLTNILAFAFVGLGLLVIVFGVYGFRRQHTSVDPRFPQQTSCLVVTGIYRYSRNPMYLGFALILCAWSLFLHSLSAALLVPLFVFYLNQWQIKPEERLLQEKFQQDYLEYMRTVRRWL